MHQLGALITGIALILSVVSRAGQPLGAGSALVYGLQMLALIYFIVGTRASVETRLTMLLPVAAGLVTIYVVEVTLALRPPPQQFAGVAAELGSPDPRSKFEVVRDLRAEGMHGVPAISPWAVRGWSRQDGVAMPIATAPSTTSVVACDEGRGWITYTTDRHGFRGGSGPSVDSATTIAVVGDSFVFGHCVTDEQTIPGRLRATWPATRNLGVAGSGPLHQLGLLREYGRHYRPRVVVWVYYEGNDLTDLADELRYPSMRDYLSGDHRVGLTDRKSETDDWLARRLDREYEAEVARVATPDGGWSPATTSWTRVLKLSRLRTVLSFGASRPSAESLDTLARILRLGRQEVNRWDGALVLVYLPDYGRYRRLASANDGVRERYLDMADSLGVPVVDLVPSFSEGGRDPRSLWSHPRGHLNADGYRIAAEAIGSVIATLGR